MFSQLIALLVPESFTINSSSFVNDVILLYADQFIPDPEDIPVNPDPSPTKAAAVTVPSTDNFEVGVVEPIPILPPGATIILLFAVILVPSTKYRESLLLLSPFAFITQT